MQIHTYIHTNIYICVCTYIYIHMYSLLIFLVGFVAFSDDLEFDRGFNGVSEISWDMVGIGYSN